jgi:hypothetical protein
MKRTLLAGTFYALAGAATLLLAASIFYSCRSGGDPHHEQSSLDEAPKTDAHVASLPQVEANAVRLTLAEDSFPTNTPSSR